MENPQQKTSFTIFIMWKEAIQMDYIIIAIAFVFTLVLVLFLFSKLTPDNTPKNLTNFISKLLLLVIAVVIAFYAALFLVQLFFNN